MSNQSSKSGPYVSYLVRRQTHSSRALSSVILAIIIVAALGFLATEGVLALSGKDPLLVNPADMWQQGFASLSDSHRPLAIIVGVLLALGGLILLAKAVLPGTLSKHALSDERAAYVVDDGVVAAGISRLVREEAGLPPGTVSTAVSKRRSVSTITPSTGRTLDQAQIQQVASEEVASWQLRPRLNSAVKIATEGRLEK